MSAQKGDESEDEDGDEGQGLLCDESGMKEVGGWHQKLMFPSIV